MSEYIVELPDKPAKVVRDGWNVRIEWDFKQREEIVRCKDCKHGYKADLSGNWYECMKPDGNGDYARWDVEPDGFCAWGESRES